MKGISVLLLVASVAVVVAQVEECPPEQETNWEIELLLRHEDCHKFYKCTFGKPIEYTCPSDLYFNLDLWECDWQHNVDCTGRNDPALTTTAAPTTPEPSTPEPTTPVPTTPEPTTPVPTTPEPTTPVPTTPEPTTPVPTTPEPTTPVPTTPEPTTPVPTTPEPTTPVPTTPTTPEPTTTTTTTTTTPPPTTTTTTTTTTPAPTTTSTTTTTRAPECEVEISPQPQPEPDSEEDGGEEQEIDFLPNGCPVDPHIHWLLPNEEDCNLFYYCVWGEKVLRQCPATLHFNPQLQVCDWPQSAGCTVSVNKHAEARRRLLDQILL